MKGLTAQSIIPILIIGLFIRLVLMPITLHSDLFFIHQYPSLFYLNGVWNIYEYIQTNYQETIALHGWNYYPPATYLLIILWQFVIQSLSPTFLILMQKLFDFERDGGGPVSQFLVIYRDPWLFLNLLLMKVQYVFFDLAALLVLLQLARRENLNLRWVALYWLLNPLSIYATYMFGQIDIMPASATLFAFGALFLVNSSEFRKKLFAMIFLGLAAGFKLYPVLLIIPTLLIIEKSWTLRVKLLIAFLAVPAVLTVILYSPNIQPLSIWYPSYIFTTIEQTVMGKLKLIAFVFLYVSILMAAWRIPKYNIRLLSGVYLAIFLGLFSLTQYRSLHYLLWMLPFLPLWFRNIKRVYFFCWFLFVLLLGFRIMARQHQLGLFIPLDPILFSSLPSIADFIRGFMPYRIVSDTTYVVYYITLALLAFSVTVHLLLYAFQKSNYAHEAV